MKLYRIKHVPTGLYYKPSRHGAKSNLTRKGKVYTSRPSLSWCSTYHHPDDVTINPSRPRTRRAAEGEFVVEELPPSDGS